MKDTLIEDFRKLGIHDLPIVSLAFNFQKQNEGFSMEFFIFLSFFVSFVVNSFFSAKSSFIRALRLL